TEIPLLARVLQIADIYDALISARSYKPAYSATQALRIIEKETAQGLRDPALVDLFFQLHSGVISQIDQSKSPGDDRFEETRRALASLDVALKLDSLPEEKSSALLASRLSR